MFQYAVPNKLDSYKLVEIVKVPNIIVFFSNKISKNFGALRARIETFFISKKIRECLAVFQYSNTVVVENIGSSGANDFHSGSKVRKSYTPLEKIL